MTEVLYEKSFTRQGEELRAMGGSNRPTPHREKGGGGYLQGGPYGSSTDPVVDAEPSRLDRAGLGLI